MLKVGKYKKIAIIFAILIIFNILLFSPQGYSEGTPGNLTTIASWDFIEAPTSPIISATGGAFWEHATLTNSMGSIPSYSSSDGSIFLSNWEDGAHTKYWEFSLPTTGFANIEITANGRGSFTSPRDFELHYSNDGYNWHTVPLSYRQLTTEFSEPPTWSNIYIQAEDVPNLLIRAVMVADISIGGSTVTNMGTSRLRDITVRGTQMSTTIPEYGDINGDGQIDVEDAILILRHLVGLIDIEAAFGSHAYTRAKVSGKGETLNVGDAILILRHAVGLITDFPVEW